MFGLDHSTLRTSGVTIHENRFFDTVRAIFGVTAGEMVRKSGVVVIRECINPEQVQPLLSELRRYQEKALRVASGIDSDEFEQHFHFNPRTVAAHLSAIDPFTSSSAKDNQCIAEDTSLFAALREAPDWKHFIDVLGSQFHFKGGRVRVVSSHASGPKRPLGAVSLHQEKWAIRGQNKPLGHNVWMCLNPDGEVANGQTSGVQFVLGGREFWKKDHSAEYAAIVEPVLNKLNRFSRLSNESTNEYLEAKDLEVSDNLAECSNIALFRPRLKVGDVVIFDHHIPHGSFVPKNAHSARVSCEFRVYPRS